METCAECGQQIKPPKFPYLFGEKVFCKPCYKMLTEPTLIEGISSAFFTGVGSLIFIGTLLVAFTPSTNPSGTHLLIAFGMGISFMTLGVLVQIKSYLRRLAHRP